jgi:hypothetical protein
MKKMPVTTGAAGRSWSGWFWPWLAVLAVLLFAGFIRVRLLNMPLERDEGEYAYGGQLILQAIPPYELAYSMKLPGVDYACAAGMAVFGRTVAGVHLTLLAVNSLTCVLVFLLGRRLAGVMVGLTACASYALMSVSLAVFGLAAHATQFVVLFAVPGVWLLWNGLIGGGRRTFFISGLLFGIAFTMKQSGFCFGLFGLAMMLGQAVQKRGVLKPDFLLPLASFVAGLALPFAALCVTVFLAGDFGRFWFWTFDYAGRYVGERSFGGVCASLVCSYDNQAPLYAGFWVLTAVGLMAAIFTGEKRRELVFVLAFLGFSLIGTTPGLYFREHYFIVILPALSLGFGLALQALQTWLASWRIRFVPPTLLALALAWNVYPQCWFFFRLTPATVAQHIYPGDPITESLRAAQFIREHSQPDARMAVIGSEPELYFYARRHSATGYIYTYPLMEPQPYASRMQSEMIREVEAARPEFLVLVNYDRSWARTGTSNPVIFQWAEQYAQQFYRPVATFKNWPATQEPARTGNFSDLPNDALLLYQRKSGVD